MQNRNELLKYIDWISLIVLSLTFFLFPLLFTSVMSDAFVLPKQILIGSGVLVSLVLLGVRTIIEGRLRLRSTPFDLPIALFGLVLFVSAFLSVNRFDSLISYIPLLFAILLYFVTVNMVRSKQAIQVLCAALLLGTALASVITALAFFKIYILPLEYAKVPFFSPLGSLLDQALVFAIVLPLAGYLAHPIFSAVLIHGKAEGIQANKLDSSNLAFGVSFVLILIGLIVTLYQLATNQQPLILPVETGFQTSFASISRDTGRVLQSFLFGSGYGTYLTDFTRFKEASYNANPKLWSFTFFRSSSYTLELLATTGFLGLASYLFIAFRVAREKWFFFPLALIGADSLLLPFSFVLQALMFIILGIFALMRGQQNPRRYPTTELSLVAFNQGLLSTQHQSEDKPAHKNSLLLPIAFSILIIIIVGSLGFQSAKYIFSDMLFQRSLIAASKNDGNGTYQLQRQAIETFQHRDAYYRVFSQTNLALANNIAAAQPQGASPSAEAQQTILTLIQQSINSGRSAVTLSPLTSLNWNNLSTIYRSLIGFGENADQFSILTNRQAIALDPNNPQQYINLGGIYYQLGQWDEAEQNFRMAASLKPDYPNAYYNLGHSLESKGDLQNALAVYKTVKSLVANDPESESLITKEITALEAKIAAGGQTQAPVAEEAEGDAALDVNQPAQQLPERNPRVQIPGVTISPTPRVSSTPAPNTEGTPTGQVTQAPSPTTAAGQ